MIKVDYNQAPVFEEFKDGFYEVVVTEVKSSSTRTGKNMLIFNYRVRDDVEQTCKGKNINFDNFVIQEENEYFAGFFAQRSVAYAVPDGMNFSSYSEWAQSVVGNAVRLKVEAVQSGQYVNANVVGWYKTEHPISNAGANIQESDFPF